MTKEERLIRLMFGDAERLSPVQWAEKYRYLGKETTNYDGPMSYDLTPYLRKIANSISPENPAQYIAIMKGSQLGFSIGGMFTMLGWIISQEPANTLFITETKEKVKEQIQNPINQMINSANLSHKIGNHNIRSDRGDKERKGVGSGDTTTGFKFEDGQLYTWSGQNVGQLSSWSIKYGLYDEVERWKGQYKSAGDFVELVDPRHKSFSRDKKLIFGSTPEVEQVSNIKPLYNMGDQEKYHVPCIKCGKDIPLLWEVDLPNGDKAGMTYKRDNLGKFIENSALYICPHCSTAFKEKHKFNMYDEENISYRKREKGQHSEEVCKWIATAEPENWRYQSFQISSLYSPLGFDSWNDYAMKWCQIHPMGKPVQVGKLHTFINQTLGETWEEKGREVDSSRLQENTRMYPYGVIPDLTCEEDGNGEIVLVTITADLNGTMDEKNPLNDDVRLDYTVKAWSESGNEEYVTSYEIAHGSIGNFERERERKKREKKGIGRDMKFTYRHGVENSVWDIFDNEVYNKEWELESGGKMRAMIVGIDAGNYTKYVYQYVNARKRSIALKGAKEEDYTSVKDDKKLYDKPKTKNVYMVKGNRIKDILADSIEMVWDRIDGAKQPEGFMNFPKPRPNKYGKAYFNEYDGEKRELKTDKIRGIVGMRWVKKHAESPQHFWDCAVYHIALMKVVCEMICTTAKVEVLWKNYCSLMKLKRNR